MDHLKMAAAMSLLLSVGIFVRIFPTSGYTRAGYDEHAYMGYVRQIQRVGVVNYDAVVRYYVKRQYQRPDAVVPATRIAFLAPAALLANTFQLEPFRALQVVSAGAGILSLLLSSLFAYRLGGKPFMLGVTALMATAPLQIHLSQRALIDSYFCFLTVTALWLAWENLQRPRHWGWLTSYTISLTLLVLTKENAAFVVFALFGVLLLNRYLRFGTVTPHLYLATIAGPLIAVFFLAALVGGLWDWIQFYRMFVEKSRLNSYSILAQDGPWYRYAVDFVILSPLLVACACGAIFQAKAKQRATLFLSAFLLLSLIGMSMVRYGISLRYAAFCELPLCWLACAQVLSLSRMASQRHRMALAVGLFLILASVNLNQYVRFFVKGAIYDPVTAALVWSSGMEKAAAPELESAKPKGERLFP